MSMPDYRYVAIDPQGRERKGRLTAANDAAARAGLIARKFHIVAVEEAGAKPAGRSLLAFSKDKLGHKELALFTRQLATLVEVAPLEEALRTLTRQSEAESARAVIGDVHAGLLEGRRLLARLADLLERQAEVRGKLIAALAYPVVLAFVAVGVVAALMIFVVPRVVEQFDDVGQQLPFLTRAVIAISGFAANWWWLALLLIAGTVFGWVRAMHRPAFKAAVDARLLRLPLIGRLLRDLYAARFARTLSTMVSSRLPLVEGLRLTVPTIRNAALAIATAGIVDQVRAGGSLSAALRDAGVFPPLLVYMTASGESAGRLEQMLERAADYLEREFDRFTAASMALLEPVIIVVMGSCVALIILSILLPILQLQNLAGL
jgi:general secretion pathway protein F